MNLPDQYRKVGLALGLVVLLAVAGCATDHDMNVPTYMTTTGDETTHLAPSETSTKSTTESTNTTIDRPIDTTTA